MAWQSEMLNYRDKNGKPYSPVYLKTLHNQLSAVFNHAVKHYNLKANPAAQVGNMGKAKGREMLFWTKAEYLKFADAMMDKPLSYYAFEMLYWCGIVAVVMTVIRFIWGGVMLGRGGDRVSLGMVIFLVRNLVAFVGPTGAA